MLYFTNMSEYMAAVKLCIQEDIHFEGTEQIVSGDTATFCYCLEITGITK